ncbi:16S rRNA (adenine(1518)-N(6)/adenine(1519)-N(6))-dimethyltransferase RsmA [Spongiivirga citrea]|uniref:Ribosomal RNA small subunit methyltransferase A n=1 Tax=Spongiivirga citrea TaxID=1481457 RepID=A0A6M0CR94_9FLAO|nr:16S rRNA (adenine(1518)-N(6)/adenine(1519)-N(6))-dimethyltransferase RsmA [Spongiivirga citrea]NER18037.1 16S rRNA (adenine(1518)-N(6)/adenine(1519)-N(6))-dimethyltransferase RsmA [Spongiivirga citrea]
MKYKQEKHKDQPKKESKKSNGDVRAKKHLGQHFLKDENIAQKIADTLTLNGYENVIEIGPGMGVLTKYILNKKVYLIAMDLDSDSVVYLNHTFPLQHPKLVGDSENFKVLEADFLKQNLYELFGEEQFAVTGNFPYNISTQIVFKMLEYRDQIPEFTGMFQKEVAKRICEKEGSKAYGILSVLVQAFYDAEYLFTVAPQVFDPPPKVQSGVLRLIRKKDFTLDCDEKLFFRVVKTAFQQRRKTLRNSLKTFNLPDNLREDTIFGLRPEQLTVAQFISLTAQIEAALN